MACEVVQNKEKPMCFSPVNVEGKVFDLETSTGIAKAEVTALDANGSPVGAFAVTNNDGYYTLRVPTTRSDDKGAVVGRKLTLRAAASNYAPFPSGVRVSLPVDTTAATKAEGSKAFVLTSSLTDVGLAKLAADAQRATISGTVEVAAGQRGVLVVAEPGSGSGPSSGPGITAIADASGAFKIFNVTPGSYQVRAFSRGANYTPVAATVQASTDVTGVQLKKSTTQAGTVSGSISLVAGANGAGTSVVLVVESTFNENLVRGEVPPGLRAPSPGTDPNLSGAYSIDGVPDGRYVVLAAFENDGNVRDPDPNIAGTQIQHITVTNGVASAQPNFKVTGAISMVGPGAGESVEEVTGTPNFQWKPYSSAQTYDLTVFDSFGNKVWERLGVPSTRNAAGNIDVPYGGPALTTGRVYQWRALAKGNAGNPISLTEDLRGLFSVK
jgi:hypothetical protein